jgi:hypothetical protein
MGSQLYPGEQLEIPGMIMSAALYGDIGHRRQALLGEASPCCRRRY